MADTTISGALFETITSDADQFLSAYTSASSLEVHVESDTFRTYTLSESKRLALSWKSLVIPSDAAYVDAVLYKDAGSASLTGNELANVLMGNASSNTLRGGAGNDSISGGGGTDVIYGGDGDDNISGSGSKGRIYGESGDDYIHNSVGFVDAGAGNDTVSSVFDASDTIYGGEGNDSLAANFGSDTVYGGAGDDYIRTRGFNKTNYLQTNTVKVALYGGEGNDSIRAGGNYLSGVIHADDVQDAIGGNDTVVAGKGQFTIYGYRGDDSLKADDGNNNVYGGYGNDTIEVGHGNNTIVSDEVKDLVGGVDQVTAGNGKNSISTGAGNDEVGIGSNYNVTQLTTSVSSINTGSGDDILRLQLSAVEGADPNESYVAFGANKIMAGDGNDLIDLELHYVLDDDGNPTYAQRHTGVLLLLDSNGDPLLDNNGEIQYIFQDGIWSIDHNLVKYVYNGDGTYTNESGVIYTTDGNGSYVDADGNVMPPAYIAYYRVDASGEVLFENGQKIYYVGDGLNTTDYTVDDITLLIVENPDGSTAEVSSSIDYSKANDTIDGGAGDDSISSGAGNDSVLGGSGSDTLDGGAGDDKLFGGDDNDSVLGGEGRDTLDGGKGDDTLDGGAGNDSLLGGDGNDQLTGGAGSDTLVGGKGNDIFLIGDDGAGFDIISDFSKTTTGKGVNAVVTSDVLEITGHLGEDDVDTVGIDESTTFDRSDFEISYSTELKGALISFTDGGGSLLLKGVALSDLVFDAEAGQFSIASVKGAGGVYTGGSFTDSIYSGGTKTDWVENG